MKLPIFLTRKTQVYAIALVVVLVCGISSVLAYTHFHEARVIEAEAPSASVTLPDAPSIKHVSDLQSAQDTLDKLNTVNSDFQKEEDQLKQLANELQ